MQTLIPDYILLSMLLPLWIFLIIMIGRFFAVYVNKLIMYFLTVFASFTGMLLVGYSFLKLENPLIHTIPFIKINDFAVNMGLHIDSLSLMLALLLLLISFGVQIFSISYMKDETKNYRFFALLNLFNFGMLSLLFSSNLFQMYIFWELVGIVSYLLIGFNYANSVKSIASKRVFLINRIGDTAFIAGNIAISYFMFNYSGNGSFAELAIEDMNVISTILYAYTPNSIYVLICGLFILASLVKSAQFPFHIWLQDAMEAELPVSALLHSATLVVAGVYLSIRIVPFYSLNNILLQIISIIGVLTAIICSFIAILETHPKKILAYSTSANLGLMFFALGIGQIRACVVLLIAHAFIKSSLFLLLPNRQNKINKLNIILFIMLGLCLSGILFSGFYAKEFLFEHVRSFAVPVFLVITFFTSIYITKLSLFIIRNSNKEEQYSIIEMGSVIFLIILNFLFYVYLMQKIYLEVSMPFFIAILGVIAVLIIDKVKFKTKLNFDFPVIEKTCYEIIPKIYQLVIKKLNLFEEKVFSNGSFVVMLSKNIVNLFNLIEEYIMNKVVVLVSNSVRSMSIKNMKLQTKNIQTYNAYALIILTIILTLVIIGYKMIIAQLS